MYRIIQRAGFLFISLFFILLPVGTHAAGDTIYVFFGEGCPHCAKEILFLQKWQKEDPAVDIQAFEIYQNKANAEFLQAVGKKLDTTVSGVPFTVIGDKYIAGWYDESVTGEQIKLLQEQCVQLGCPDIVSIVREGGESIPNESKKASGQLLGDTIRVPLLGEIDWRGFSLPVFTMIIAVLDGFNPCAMWVLIFLIGLLFGMKNKVRMWTLGITFLVVSAAVYFVFMAAWLNILLFLGFIAAIRIVIGLVALGGGGYNIREWWHNKTGACKVTGQEKRRRVFDKLKQVTQERSFLIALIGIIALAFVVNLVELVCSAGLPAVYTQVLALSELASWQYYLYLLLYIFIFLLDDIIVFSVAMVTLKVTGLSSKYSRYSNLIGGTIMVIIGILLLFKPEWLMFG